MMRPLLATIFALALVVGPGTAATEVASDELTRALVRARGDSSRAFCLRVDCTDQECSRALEIFESGAAIWDHRVQLPATSSLRGDSLGVLLSHGFADLRSSYGGKPEKVRSQAAQRVSCRVHVEIDGLSRSSVQYAEGEQSKELAGLADALLDLAEPLAGRGTGAADLKDGLEKMEQGKLAPEVLWLRFVELPKKGVEDAGAILLVEDGFMTWRRYAPGRELGERISETLTRPRIDRLVRALRESQVESLPVNLWSEGHFELQVELLGHRSAVVARSFARQSADLHKEAQQRFLSLVDTLQDLGASLGN